MRLPQAILLQFGNPKGLVGFVIGLSMAWINRHINAEGISLLGVRPRDHVLEVGFGPGVSIRRLAVLAREGAVVGLDRSRVMVIQACWLNQGAIKQGRVALAYGTAEAMPLASEQFDRVYSCNAYWFWENKAACVRELWRVTKRGATVVTALQPRGASEEWRRETGEMVRDMFVSAGFSQAEVLVVPMPPEPGILVTVKK